MGAYSYISSKIELLLPRSAKLKYVGRPAAAAPATGIGKIHKKEHTELLNFWKNL